MVDAEKFVGDDANGAFSTAQEAKAASLEVSVGSYDPQARHEYEAFCSGTLYATPQNPGFVAAWAQENSTDLIVISAAINGRAALKLVLEITRDGTAVIARYPGGRHANGNFPAFGADKNFAELSRKIAEAIKLARPDVDLVLLERNERDRNGKTNPLLTNAATQSPNIALAVDLHGGFDALLERASGKRKRKKYRSQSRKFEAAGGHRRYAATTADEVDHLLAGFFEMKAARFRQMGITDVFADDGVKRSFRRMFVTALDRDRPDFVLHGLEVGGILRAVTGSSASGKRLTCEFSAFRDDELAATSPGDYLFFENINEACENGFAIYDFGVGDERYKRLWCDIESRHFDVYLPLTAKGRMVSTSKRAIGTLKRAIKDNPALWSIIKRLRKSKGSDSAEDDS